MSEILAKARALANTRPNWATFDREVFGKGGLIDRECDDRKAFQQTEEYAELFRLLKQLRVASYDGCREPTAVITVRLPASVHQRLKEEAHELRTSLNKLCTDKLLELPTDTADETTAASV